MKHNRMLPSIPKGAEDLIIHAISDLNDYFDSIKSSTHFHQFADEGEVMVEILFNVSIAFLIGQVLEASKKSAIINNKTKKPLSPKDRFVVMMNRAISHMHSVGTKASKGLMP